jgi:hypothetical protein
MRVIEQPLSEPSSRAPTRIQRDDLRTIDFLGAMGIRKIPRQGLQVLLGKSGLPLTEVWMRHHCQNVFSLDAAPR